MKKNSGQKEQDGKYESSDVFRNWDGLPKLGDWESKGKWRLFYKVNLLTNLLNDLLNA